MKAEMEKRIRTRLDGLKERLVGELPARLDQLEYAYQSWLHSRDPADLQTFHRLSHSLTGAAATFGFADLATTTRTLESHLKALCQSRASSSAQIEAIPAMMEAVATSVHAILEPA